VYDLPYRRDFHRLEPIKDAAGSNADYQPSARQPAPSTNRTVPNAIR
jgi:hypothetical protein